MQEFKIGLNEEGQRLDKFLHKYLKEANTGFLYKMLRKKNITLNKKKADGKEILQENDCVQFFFSDETFLKFRGCSDESKTNMATVITESENNKEIYEKQKKSIKKKSAYEKAFELLKGIEIIYENEHVILLNKPAGILSQKSAPNDLSVNEWLIGYLLAFEKITYEQLETFKPSICNRLDRNTSGLMICGKSLIGSQTMNELIKERKIKKYYRTFVKGKVTQGCYIKGYLKKDEARNKVSLQETVTNTEKQDYQEIETAYVPITSWNDYTYLEVCLITGKTHQIRAHLASVGHPLLGDEKYGNRKWNASFQHLKLPKWQLLHSYRVEFPTMDEKFADLSNKQFVAKEPEIYKKILKTG